ncbi:putative efflux protein, MATE family [Anaerobranca californiensis DSM 14826]|jgi:putative MATE family efflux protein|uniref:Probable multidrug resistance protein NorM n=1 Tax=Anaerobranca californiensis DSM 14826 TaxID=1120989 RepID=A0A1M6PXE6_9FIRM|nr:MATE family efflux transporter [Anaerobranca californiensis]SHK12654.1 putative efflux protein, MATE family [Anaerobranca californiensis DSM 14826]
MKDLTEGNIPKQIFYFTLPMLIGNIFQQLYNTVDSIVIGKFEGTEALAAVGSSFPVIFLLVALLMGITMGATILISQYFGAKDFENVKKTVTTTYIFLFFASILTTILGLTFSSNILKLLNTPPSVLPLVQSYLNIMFIGMVAMFGYNTISAILRGVGDSKTPLIFLIIASIINILLDLLFVGVFRWGVAGVAWATVIAQTSSFIFGLFYLKKNNSILYVTFKDLTFDTKIFIKSLKIGVPTGVQQTLFSLGMLAVQRMVNSFGEVTMAAYTAAGRIDSFALMPFMNFGTAISTFVGQNIGANKLHRVKKGYLTTVLMTSVTAIFVTITLYFFGEPLIKLFDSNPDVVNIGLRKIRIVSTFYILIGIMFVTLGVIRGAGEAFVPMIISILTLWLIRIPVASFLIPHLGSDGIWWSFPIGWMVGITLSLIYYNSGRWKNKGVVKNKAKDVNEDKSEMEMEVAIDAR